LDGDEGEGEINWKEAAHKVKVQDYQSKFMEDHY
jgi:hypothetical protein